MKFMKELLQINEAAKDKEREQKALKPRAKVLDDALRSKRNTKHYSPKSDYVRAKEKSKGRRDLTEGDKATD